MGRDGVSVEHDDEGIPLLDEASAFALAADFDREFADEAPHHVYTLTLVPKPVPPRPSVGMGRMTVTWDGGMYRYGNGFAVPSVGLFAFEHRCTDAQLAALLALPEQTLQWEREHGGAA
jgi:hypothetical protein